MARGSSKADVTALLARGLTARAWNHKSLPILSTDEIDADIRHMTAYERAHDRYHQLAYQARNHSNRRTTAVPSLPTRLDPDLDQRQQAAMQHVLRAESTRQALESTYVAVTAHYVDTCHRLKQKVENDQVMREYLQRQVAQLAVLRTQVQMARDIHAVLQYRQKHPATAMETDSKPGESPTSGEGKKMSLVDAWEAVKVPPSNDPPPSVLTMTARNEPATPHGVPLLVSALSTVPEKSVAWMVDSRKVGTTRKTQDDADEEEERLQEEKEAAKKKEEEAAEGKKDSPEKTQDDKKDTAEEQMEVDGSAENEKGAPESQGKSPSEIKETKEDEEKRKLEQAKLLKEFWEPPAETVSNPMDTRHHGPLVWLPNHLPSLHYDEDEEEAAETEAASSSSTKKAPPKTLTIEDLSPDTEDVLELREQVSRLRAELESEGKQNNEILAQTSALRRNLDTHTIWMTCIRQETEAVLYRHNVVLSSPEVASKVEAAWEKQVAESAANESQRSSTTPPPTTVTTSKVERAVNDEDNKLEEEDNSNDGDDEGDDDSGELPSGGKRGTQNHSSPSRKKRKV